MHMVLALQGAMTLVTSEHPEMVSVVRSLVWYSWKAMHIGTHTPLY